MMPHAGQPVLTRGRAPGPGAAAMILVHGRNAAPGNILELTPSFDHPAFTFLAPAAHGGAWYPFSFLSETERNEPGLSSGLWVIDDLIRSLERKGVPRRRIVLLGFSQGGCLSAEYAVRHAARLGGVVVLSGGVIGPPGTTWRYPGDFEGTPVFLGCSDVDPHIPKLRVDESERVFSEMGAEVTERIYPGMGHQVIEDELDWVRALVERIGEAG